MKKQDHQEVLARSVHPALADLALVDVREVAVAVSKSVSWVHGAVRAKEFPPPIRYGQRCTRWRVSDIRAWLIDQTERAAKDAENEERLLAWASRTSAKAQAKRLDARGAAERSVQRARNVSASARALLSEAAQ